MESKVKIVKNLFCNSVWFWFISEKNVTLTRKNLEFALMTRILLQTCLDFSAVSQFGLLICEVPTTTVEAKERPLRPSVFES